MKTVLYALLLTLFLAGCSTSPKKRNTNEPIIKPPPSTEIDYHALQRQLGIETSVGQVGLQERLFDACAIGSALPSMRDCHRAYFALIQFQLSCRDSEQSESILSAADLRPLISRTLKWQVGSKSGKIQTDAQGFGEIRVIGQTSVKRKHLRISTGRDFLVMTAGQATNVVTPPSWCE